MFKQKRFHKKTFRVNQKKKKKEKKRKKKLVHFGIKSGNV